MAKSTEKAKKPVAKKTTLKKDAKKPSRAKTVSIFYHAVGQHVQTLKYPAGSTLQTISDDLNIKDFTLSLNGKEIKPDYFGEYPLSKDDTVRLGQRTKGNS